VLFDSLNLWVDPEPHSGPENMAIDEWLWETAEQATLRIYKWDGAWGSLGYFSSLNEASQALPDLDWVRRYTGGGIVDHRKDWTYTLFIPNSSTAAQQKGAKIYCAIHGALAEALAKESISAMLSGGDGVTGSMVCFENPVCHDLINPHGQKIAGAGQRKGKRGILHQGSLAIEASPTESTHRAEQFAQALARSFTVVSLQATKDVVEAKIDSRYGKPEWTQKRS